MKYRFLLVSSALILLIALFASLNGGVSKSENSPASLPLLDSYGNDYKGLSRHPPSRPRRSLLSLPPKRDTALIAALDGTMYLVESGSMRVIWSFETGAPIYSSYQAPVNKNNDKENVSGLSTEFLECGDDWGLYVQTTHFGKMRLSTSIADFVRATPTISDDGAVTLGSKRSTMFDIDAKTGRIIQSYAISDFDNSSAWWSDEKQSVMDIPSRKNQDLVKADGVELNTPELLLKIFRTDYSLQSVGPKSEKVLWSMKVAEFEAILYCQPNDLSGPFSDSEDNYATDIGLDFAMPYPCLEKKEVYRLRKNLLLESSSPERLLGPNHEKEMFPMPASNPMLPSQPNVGRFLKGHDENMMLPGPVAAHMPNSLSPLPANMGFFDNNDNAATIPQHPVEISESVEVDVNRIIERWTVLPLVLFVVFLLGSSIYHSLMVKEQTTFKSQKSESELKSGPPKKKRIRKSGKSGSTVDKRDKLLPSEDEDVLAYGETDREAWLQFNKIDEGADGRRIGKLLVSNKEIAKGSNGTIVLEGMHEGRKVAVKRLVLAHHDVAFKEIQNLIASDRHPNIVRWYGVEHDEDFVYLALERCTCNLDDLVQIYSDISENSMFSKDQTSRCMLKAQIEMGTDNKQNLWKANGYPSSLLLKLMRDVVSGLVHLHELGIIHRDLKPQNVLIIKERSLCAKLSDMGISKRLLGDMSSLGHNATGCGSSGWQAPEQLSLGRQTRAVDLFSLGCVLFFCITGGRHPFGERLERDVNIVKNQKDLFLVEFIPEAEDLISRLLDPHPDQRPKASEVLQHPFFWSSEMRLSFLRDASDRVELEDRGTASDILKALENIAPVALGTKWHEKLEATFINNIGHYRRYKFDSVRDLLRVMRNKLNHYRELPQEIQELVGPVPEGFNDYFASRFPRLLIEVYKVIRGYCMREESFQRYFNNVD